jgi:hypothetical protein
VKDETPTADVNLDRCDRAVSMPEIPAATALRDARLGRMLGDPQLLLAMNRDHCTGTAIVLSRCTLTATGRFLALGPSDPFGGTRDILVLLEHLIKRVATFHIEL